jgi:hypothetical protein
MTAHDPRQSSWQVNISRTGDGLAGASSPSWIPDGSVSACMVCLNRFNLLRRRHHCRRCGACVCGTCAAARVPASALAGCQALDTKPAPAADADDGDASGAVSAKVNNALVSGTCLENVRVCSRCAKVIDEQLKLKLRSRGWKAKPSAAVSSPPAAPNSSDAAPPPAPEQSQMPPTPPTHDQDASVTPSPLADEVGIGGTEL